MKRCNVAPYEGNEPYIFVSYCHKDKAKVFPVIETLARAGYRIWYDEGINPGSEWPEIIASHLNNCTVCIAFISENSLNSHNCRREVNFAILKKKQFVSIMLEEVELSLGMQMQLSALQSILKYTYENQNDFYQKLIETNCIEMCLGEENQNIIISKEEDYQDEQKVKVEKRDPFSDKWIKGEYAGDKEIEFEEIYHYYLVRKNTAEKIEIDRNKFKLGRKHELCDYTITDNLAISRVHAIFTIKDDECYVTDNHSLNKTKINGVIIEADIPVKLNNHDVIQLWNEQFILLISKEERVKEK